MITFSALIDHFVAGLAALTADFDIPVHHVDEPITGELLGRLAMKDVTIFVGVDKLAAKDDYGVEASMYTASFAIGVVVDDALRQRNPTIGPDLIDAVRVAVKYLADACVEGQLTDMSIAPDAKLIDGAGCTMWLLAFEVDDVELSTNTNLDFVKHAFASTLARAGGTTEPATPELPTLSTIEVDVFDGGEEPEVEVLIE
jgi:hypothetical protein